MKLVRLTLEMASIIMMAIAIFAPSISAQTDTSPSSVWTPSAYASSATAGATAWLTLPMGHLDDPTNTFWQIFHLSVNDGSITNESIDTGVATNGGILVGNLDGPKIAVAVRPSIDLAFSPLLFAPSSGGKNWQVTAPATGSISRLGQRGDRLVAVSINGKISSVIEQSAPTSSWKTIGTLPTLQKEPNFRPCSPTAITSVAFDQTGAPIIGVACAIPGVVGLFRYRKQQWNRLSILHAGTLHGVISVLSLESCGERICGLVASNTGGKTPLFLLTLMTKGANLDPIGIAPEGARISAIGGTDDGGLWLLYRRRGSIHGLVKLTVNSQSIALPTMATGAATLVATATGTIYSFALAGGGGALVESKLSTDSPYHWRSVVTRHFSIPYGSSS